MNSDLLWTLKEKNNDFTIGHWNVNAVFPFLFILPLWVLKQYLSQESWEKREMCTVVDNLWEEGEEEEGRVSTELL